MLIFIRNLKLTTTGGCYSFYFTQI